MGRKLTKFQHDKTGLLFGETHRVDEWRPNENLPDLGGHTDVWMDLEYDKKSKHKTVPCGISISLRDGSKQYMPFGHVEGGNLDEGKIKDWALKELRGKKLRNINIGGDAQVMLNWGVDLEKMGCELHDISYASALIDEEQFKSPNLDELCFKFLDGKRKNDSVSKANWANLDWAKLRPQDIHQAHSSRVGPYAEDDAERAREVDDAEQPFLDRDGLHAVMSLEDELIWANNHMERSMMRMDVPLLEEWRGSSSQEYAQLAMAIWEETGVKLKPNSAASWHELCKKAGMDTPKYESGYKTVRKGGQSMQLFVDEIIKGYTDEFLRGSIKKNGYPLMASGLAMRRIDSLQTKYLDKYFDAMQGDLVPFSLYQLRALEEDYGTLVGRYSSANVNIQQVFKPGNQKDKFCNCGAKKDAPHSPSCFGLKYIIRQLVIPDDDCVLAATDGSQLQFRAFAHYSNDPGLIKAYMENWDVDFHQMVADLFSLSRQAAKHNNFAMVLGMGREKLADRMGLSCECKPREWWSRLTRMKLGREEKQRHIFGINDNHASGCPACKSNDLADEYNAEFPAAKKTMEKVTKFAEGSTRKDAEGRGFVRSLLGRRCRYVEGDKFYSAFAALLQMSEADLVKKKINTLYKNRELIGIKKLRFPVHDEVVKDIYKDNLDRNLRRLNECTNGIVEEGVRMRVPMIWETKTGPNWYQMQKSPYSFKNLGREVTYQ